MTTTQTDPREVARTYFESWRAKDFDVLQSLLADEVTFVGPLGHAEGAEACRKGVEQLSKITTDIDVKQMCVDGADVLTWFELHTAVAEPTPVVNWSRVIDGKITRIRATFDSRVLQGAG
jgi:ketosteroid isomerase-like protein